MSLNKIAAAIADILPGDLSDEVRKSINIGVQSVLEKMELVTREEFEIQEKVLETFLILRQALAHFLQGLNEGFPHRFRPGVVVGYLKSTWLMNPPEEVLACTILLVLRGHLQPKFLVPSDNFPLEPFLLDQEVEGWRVCRPFHLQEFQQVLSQSDLGFVFHPSKGRS